MLQLKRYQIVFDCESPNRDRYRRFAIEYDHGLEAKTRAYSQNDLSDLNIGPQSLRKRIAELNGSLSLLSSPQGVELHVELPFCSNVPI